jgi:hypothetical protein
LRPGQIKVMSGVVLSELAATANLLQLRRARGVLLELWHVGKSRQ